MKNISLFTLIEIALKHIFIIIAAALLVAVTAFCYCEFVAVPQYSATGSLIVTNGAIVSVDDFNYEDYNSSENLENTDIQASLSFANTVIEILNTNDIYKELSNELNGKYTYGQLKTSSSIQRRSTNTLSIDISFTANTRDEAVMFVNEYLNLTPEYINSIVPKTAVKITSYAENAGKIYPRTLITTVLSGIVGAAIAYAILFLIYCANTVIKSEDDFKDRFDVPVLGCIPDFATAKTEKYYKKYSYTKGGKKKYEK